MPKRGKSLGAHARGEQSKKLSLATARPHRAPSHPRAPRGRAAATEPEEAPAVPASEAAEVAALEPTAPVWHLARCRTCGRGVKFEPLPSGHGFAIRVYHGFDQNTTFGIGPSGWPLCPEHGHGEMQGWDEALVPASDAISQVAANVNGNGTGPQQRKLPLPVLEPNWKGMQQQTNELRREVRQKLARWKSKHDEAATLKKLADEAQARLSEWEDQCDTRERDLTDHLEREAEKAAAAALEAEPPHDAVDASSADVQAGA